MVPCTLLYTRLRPTYPLNCAFQFRVRLQPPTPQPLDFTNHSVTFAVAYASSADTWATREDLFPNPPGSFDAAGQCVVNVLVAQDALADVALELGCSVFDVRLRLEMKVFFSGDQIGDLVLSSTWRFCPETVSSYSRIFHKNNFHLLPAPVRLALLDVGISDVSLFQKSVVVQFFFQVASWARLPNQKQKKIVVGLQTARLLPNPPQTGYIKRPFCLRA